MRLQILFCCTLVCSLALVAGQVKSSAASSAAATQTKPADPSTPHLEKRGLATQLIVDGKPFLVLGAEPPTSAPSNIE